MLVAAGALANMLILFLNPVNDLGNTELLITGTLFDVVFYLGALTLRLPDGPPRQRTPRRDPPASDDEELDQLIESIQGDETEE